VTGTSHKTWVAILIFIFGVTVSQSEFNLLLRVSENYHNLPSFEIAGHVTATIPGTELQASIETVDAGVGQSFVPEHSSALKHREVQRFGTIEITDKDGNPGQPSAVVGIMAPNHWGHYYGIATDIVSVKELPSQVVELGGVSVDCHVFEIVYDRDRWKPEESTVKYWIDPKRLLVVKEEFAELSGRHSDSVLWHWVYTADSIKLNRPPPEWLTQFPPARGDYLRPEWLGREAPDFTLLDLDGRPVTLSSLRGKVVVLDFWATWCGPCNEEMRALKKIDDEHKAKQVIVLGISDERPSTIKKWRAKNQRNLPSLVDPEGKTAEQYGVEGIPAIIVIGRDGKVVSYYTGTQSELSLGALIDKSLNEGHTKNK
jgi:peroxiredoxin